MSPAPVRVEGVNVLAGEVHNMSRYRPAHLATRKARPRRRHAGVNLLLAELELTAALLGNGGKGGD